MPRQSLGLASSRIYQLQSIVALAPGTRLGAYEILSLIGTGGMGEVYRARDSRLARDVAIKVLPSEVAADPDRLAVEGETLADRIGRGPMQLGEIVDTAMQIAAALEAAHQNGIVHRDLKPVNVKITGGGRIKVLDFGLALRLRGKEFADLTTRPSLTRAGTVVGTVPYMSPEQLRAEPAEPPSDLWALGVLLYEMTTGSRPFQGNTEFEVSSAILNDPPRAFPSRVTPQLQAVITRCLQKLSSHRYQRASEVYAALEAIAGRGGLHNGRRTVFLLRGAVAAALIALASLAIAGWFVFLRPRSSNVSAAPVRSIAVLPLENLSREPDQDFFVAGMHEALITDLAQIGLQKVIAKPSADAFKNTKKPLRDVGRELGVEDIGDVFDAAERARDGHCTRAPSCDHLRAERPPHRRAPRRFGGSRRVPQGTLVICQLRDHR